MSIARPFKKAIIHGISMFPTLRTGQAVYYSECPAKALHRGDIILFKINKKIICHRLIGKWQFKNKIILFEKGDNPLYLISQLKPTNVLGKTINQPTRPLWLLALTMPGICIGYILFTLKNICYKHKSLGIIKVLTNVTRQHS